MKYQYEPLGDEYEFQTFLKDLFNAIYNTTSFEEYGKKGQTQYGVDVYSPELKIAIQAKKKDINRNSRAVINELLSDLANTNILVDQFPHSIEHLYFATTTTKHLQIQDACIKASISENRMVQFFCWSDIQEAITKFPSVRNKYFPYLKENKIEKENDELKQRLDQLEKLILQQIAANTIENKQYRSIPKCDILLPDVEMTHLKYLIASILKIALYKVFSTIEYKEFTCLFNYGKSFTRYQDGTSSPGFEIISGQVTFLGECARLVKMLQHNHDKFWHQLEEYESNETYNKIRLTMAFLPIEGLTAYNFIIDGQTSSYQIEPEFFDRLDYTRLDTLSYVLPFIASTTYPSLHVLDFDQLNHYPAFMKIIHNTLSENFIRLGALKVNVKNFEDWDYDYNIEKNND